MRILPALLIVLMVGCSSEPPPKQTPSAPETDSTVENPVEQQPTNEEQATNTLKLTLESWVFDDVKDLDEWKQEHPTITVLDQRWSIRPFDKQRPVTLLKYEIANSRESEEVVDGVEFSFEFNVLLSLQDAANTDFTRRQSYTVTKEKSGNYLITSGPN